MASHILPTEDEKFLHIPHDERWEPLKPVIIGLYMGHNNSGKPMTIPQLAAHMKQHYSFLAQ
jgi:hypothetical protein